MALLFIYFYGVCVINLFPFIFYFFQYSHFLILSNVTFCGASVLLFFPFLYVPFYFLVNLLFFFVKYIAEKEEESKRRSGKLKKE
jgi:hypothetical protein